MPHVYNLQDTTSGAHTEGNEWDWETSDNAVPDEDAAASVIIHEGIGRKLIANRLRRLADIVEKGIGFIDPLLD